MRPCNDELPESVQPRCAAASAAHGRWMAGGARHGGGSDQLGYPAGSTLGGAAGGDSVRARRDRAGGRDRLGCPNRRRGAYAGEVGGRVRVGVPVACKPDPADPSFLADQDGLYDPAQFASTQYYLTDYHWKLDRSIDARNITSARVQFDPGLQAWAIVLDFDAAGAAEWSAVTTGAFRARQGSPANRIVVFFGKDVVSAPGVVSPSSTSTEILGNFTEPSAQAVVDAMRSAGRP